MISKVGDIEYGKLYFAFWGWFSQLTLLLYYEVKEQYMIESVT